MSNQKTPFGFQAAISTLRNSLLILTFLATPTLGADRPEPAPSGHYIADIAHTSVTWKISHFGLSNYTARFVMAKAVLDWNAEEPTQSKLEVSIDPSSVRTDFPAPQEEDFDRKIATDKAFLAGQPITFVATSIEKTDDRNGRVTGDLTFRGQTHPATMEVTFNGSFAKHPMEKVAKLGFSGTLVIDRTKWGLDFALPALGRDVSVTIETEFSQE
ncbi:YceI family protein [Rhizobium alvei]|uniref:YceI family protein n=1 Tax=Rhizobium alvei TaxID=1132659 RepID=A0ABT8YNB3_9HYPH|nr:YceI family protein [Rhizobium alvei]MDO6964794.1 YceI family protein [Rhizobium alvei]